MIPSLTAPGDRTLLASYAGDSNFAASSGTTAHRVRYNTTTTITADSPDPSTPAQSVTVNYTVAPTQAGGPAPTGNVTVTDGVSSCTGTAAAGTCSVTLTTNGTRTLIATYIGDGSNKTSTSTGAAHTVSSTGSLYTLTVTRSGSGTGTVTSQDGGINCGATCSHGYAAGATVSLSATPASGSVFTGWLGTCTGAGACSVTLNNDSSLSATFAPVATGNKVLDIDNNTAYGALTDGLLVTRYLFGLTGAALTNGAIGANALRTDPTQILGYLNDIRPKLDVDGNGQADALTDGLLILRYMFGLRGAQMAQGVIAAGATRTAAQIESYLQSLMP